MFFFHDQDKIVKKLASVDEKEAQQGMLLADQVLGNNINPESLETAELKVKTNRTIINKSEPLETDPNKMSQGSYNFL